MNIDINALARFQAESNRIEGILGIRPVEVDALQMLLQVERLTVEEVERYVSVVQPDARLRAWSGMNVRVGDHTPPEGGVWIKARLADILAGAHRPAGGRTPRFTHMVFENLHPFTDGNGRAGRALWLWQHQHHGTAERPLRLGFLHCFYLETLEEFDR